MDLLVVPGARAQGRVVGPGGAAAGDATVTATGDLEGRQLGTRYATAPVATDARGAFAFGDLVPGVTYSFEATAPGYPDSNAQWYMAAAGAPLSLEIRLDAPHWIRVRVEDAGNGRPVADAEVDFGRGTALTDAEGVARLGPFAPGSWHASVTAPGPLSIDVHRVTLSTWETGSHAPRGLILRAVEAWIAKSKGGRRA